MPKQRITQEMVIETAFEIARRGGMEEVLVKNIAKNLGCSVQPIYSYCSNMKELREQVALRARQFIAEYIRAHTDPDDPFRSTGNAYIRLAGEEPNILRIFILQTRKGVRSLDDLYRLETDPQMAKYIADSLSTDLDSARELHLHMLIYSIGLGTIFSGTTPGIPIDEIYSQQEQAYRAFSNDTLGRKKQK